MGAMLVYMQACPDKVQDGLPAGLKLHEAVAHKSMRLRSYTVQMTEASGTHKSPKAHWRHWHFRSYPIRKDGERRKGAVFVSGGWVNPPEQAETVKGPGHEFDEDGKPPIEMVG